MGRLYCGYFFVRRHGTTSYGRAVRGSASCAGSLTRYSNLHGSAHPDWSRGRRKLSTAVKESTAMSAIKTPAKGKSTVTPKTPAKGKSLATPKKPTRRTLPAPTPASIHALFVAMRTLGWRSGLEHAHSDRRPAPESVPIDATTQLPTADQIEATFQAAWEFGLGQISREEELFLHTLGNLSCRHRDGIKDLRAIAVSIQKNQPWPNKTLDPGHAERYLGRYNRHYSTGDLPQVSPATPREQAMFAVLRNVGIYAAQNLDHAPLRPPVLRDQEARPKYASQGWHEAARALATELGWWCQNPIETEFIDLLRRCNTSGRAFLHATLGAMLHRTFDSRA
jgi:hypothetical protein